MSRPSSAMGSGNGPSWGQPACGCSTSPNRATRSPAPHRSPPPPGGPSAAASRRPRRGHGSRERGQDLIGRGPAAVDQPVGQPPDAVASGLERQRDHTGGNNRQPQVRLPLRADQGADPHHDGQVDQREGGGEQPVDQGAADDPVDVVPGEFIAAVREAIAATVRRQGPDRRSPQLAILAGHRGRGWRVRVDPPASSGVGRYG
jgi:hypothetical protein